MSQDRPFVWKSYWKQLVGHQAEWGGISGNNQGGGNGVGLTDEDLDIVPTCWLCRSGS